MAAGVRQSTTSRPSVDDVVMLMVAQTWPLGMAKASVEPHASDSPTIRSRVPPERMPL